MDHGLCLCLCLSLEMCALAGFVECMYTELTTSQSAMARGFGGVCYASLPPDASQYIQRAAAHTFLVSDAVVGSENDMLGSSCSEKYDTGSYSANSLWAPKIDRSTATMFLRQGKSARATCQKAMVGECAHC
jgi:hypothetical protein